MIKPSFNFAVNNKFYSIKICSHYTHSSIKKIAGLIQLHILDIIILFQCTQGSYTAPNNKTKPDGEALALPNPGESKQGNIGHQHV